MGKAQKLMIAIIVLLMTAISFLHYSTELVAYHYHLFYQGLYFLVVILGGFWFGLRGALVTSAAITVVYLPFTVVKWNGFSAEDFGRVMEMVLYTATGLILGILRDRERAHQRLVRDAERLAAMGRAMSAVAHDMKTPLIAIGGFTSMVQRNLDRLDPSNEELSTSLKQSAERLVIVIKETHRLENMVKEMLDFSRPLELRRSREDINKVIAESVSIVEDVAKERNVILQSPPPHENLLVSFDCMRIKQVIINLLLNAIQASPAGETVSVSTCVCNGSLFIDVMDCGCGIPLNKREEIFLPFVTTKNDGTGLGLPIANKIVEAHSGCLKIIDNSERGLTFRVILPT